MSRIIVSAIALGLACACGAEYRVGPKQGLQPFSGDAHASTESFTCGQPLQAEGYSVTTQVVGSDCRLTFERDVTVATADDYSRLTDFQGLVKAVDLEVRSLTFQDEDTGATLSLETQVKDALLSVNGQVVLTKVQLTALPVTVRLDGPALESLRAQIEARQPAIVHLSATLVVTPPFPKRLAVHYEVQPYVVLGPH
jgi:hypothetical protein